MALLHRAEIRPTKLELLGGWLPYRSWFAGPRDAGLSRVAAARFDDPAGAVGIEVLLVRAGDGPVLHVPLTYRGAPLAGAGAFLVGTTEHGVLGTRWVYDAAGDPVFAAVLAEVIRTGGAQAIEKLVEDDRVVVREPSLLLRGSGGPGTGAAGPGRAGGIEVTDGDPTVIGTRSGSLHLVRTPSAPHTGSGAVLTGRWSGVDTPVVLARLAG
ncbi:CG0192-related protein [Actinoplanes teichomyceticus]|uniref:Maltokinase N-terminal cap domain-containing protein n=1 Tax=Actinoplanes teichomyceticus TaxID=1867 RepID=A0A561WL07_ACTTI|nr:hypothetical protein [Actinoplanes teichomyceticus]TWG24544.1 hypothetical protein FHX34_1021104 [Actinoplanes teichomyceticus]GIF16844.1 hypothetical protein Ate01nite_68760 [Actinoplanes teichomyceticus]